MCVFGSVGRPVIEVGFRGVQEQCVSKVDNGWYETISQLGNGTLTQ